MELKSVFEQIQAAEKAGNLTPEEKRKLEEQAAEKGLQALFKARVSHFACTSMVLTFTHTGYEVGDRERAPRDMRSRTRGSLHPTLQGNTARGGPSAPW